MRARHDEVERDGRNLATGHKALVGISTASISTSRAETISARPATFVDDEYEITSDGEVVATVSKKWLRVRDTCGVEIRQGEDEPLLLPRAVALDKMSRN